MKNTNGKRKAVKIVSRSLWILLVLIAMAGVARAAVSRLASRRTSLTESWIQR